MTPSEAVKTCFRKYVTFSGRASRSEFWWFVFFCFGISAIIAAIHSAIFGPSVYVNEGITFFADGTQEPFRKVTQTYDGGIAGTLFSFATFLPLLSATWRRLHDTNRSGWKSLTPIAVAVVLIAISFLASSYFFGLLAIISTLIATIFLVVMLAQKSSTDPNQYGTNLHEVSL